MPVPPPTPELADLVRSLGAPGVKTLVKTYLQDFPTSLRAFPVSDRPTCHRLAHGMKSTSRLVGALALSQRMADIEQRLLDVNGGDVSLEELAAIAAEFATIAGPLREFAAG